MLLISKMLTLGKRLSNVPYWKTTINISQEFKAFDDNLTNIRELATSVENKLREYVKENQSFDDINEIERIADELIMIEEVEEFDSLLESLYDWGDIDHRLWIQTIED